MSEPHISIAWIGGNCPVQAEGTIDGAVFYFRARGDGWSFHVAATDDAFFRAKEWLYEEPYGDGPYGAGWMSKDEARGFIEKAAKLYHERAKPEEAV